jgi:hypothetical protein
VIPDAGSFEAGDEIETQLSLSKGRGNSLPEPVRAFMEPRFGVDFGQVRVHSDNETVQMNEAVGARAFTHGQDIYFGAGQSPTDLALTAHELTHVVQQTGGMPLQAKRREELLPMDAGPSVQRACVACASGAAPYPRCAEEGSALRRKHVMVQRMRSGVGTPSIHDISVLQHTFGNQAVGRLLHEGGWGQSAVGKGNNVNIASEVQNSLRVNEGLKEATERGKSTRSENFVMRQDIRRSEDRKSRGSKPKDAPRGTKPIDQTGLDHDQIHDIKDGVGAGPADWVGISPDGHVITNDENGNAEDHGPWEDYTNSRYEVPDWLWKALVGVALAAGTLAVVVCFATGPCTVGTLIGALGYAAAILVIGLLTGAEGSDGTVASKENDRENNGQTTAVNTYA